MNYEEVGMVLAKLAVYDNRIVGEAEVMAWHEVIGRYDVRDCLDAVALHYSESPQRAMPADIRKLAMGIRDRRRAAEARAALDPAPQPRRSAEVEALIREVAKKRPKVEFEDITDGQARAIARARRERERATKSSGEGESQ
ncbi:hypothetical protein [Actinokineospora sp.]|uniref:hypothetical protein n=1 Tax=Actinokineospora sp. TaxID=1872133 RepID=UPI003D6AA081